MWETDRERLENNIRKVTDSLMEQGNSYEIGLSLRGLFYYITRMEAQLNETRALLNAVKYGPGDWT